MMRESGRAGTLYLVPNLLGAVAPQRVLPARTIDVARGLAHWVVETPKAARAFLGTLALSRPIAELDIRPLAGERGDALRATLETLRSGADVGLLSDAGCPGVADPGAHLVEAAHENAIRVVPLVGPSAILLALMASGLNGQHFCFHGYLPVKTEARVNALSAIEQQSRAQRRTELFIETPYRNVALLRAACESLAPRTRLCVAADLTLDTETVDCRSIARWRGDDVQRFDRRPAIFLLQA